jgi:hypothetical protein
VVKVWKDVMRTVLTRAEPIWLVIVVGTQVEAFATTVGMQVGIRVTPSMMALRSSVDTIVETPIVETSEVVKMVAVGVVWQAI